MKNYTSKFLKIVAWGYLAFPIVYLGLVAILFDVPATGLGDVLLSPAYYVSSAIAVLTGYGLREMRRWAWYLLLLSTVLVAYENAVIARQLGESHHALAAYVASLVALAALISRISREVRVPYFFPKIRWWESNPRYRLSVPARLSSSTGGTGGPGGGDALDVEILDMSMGGCFAKLRSDLGQGENVKLAFKVFGLAVECKGMIVWRTQSTVTHPRGVGIKFALETREQRRVLRLVNARLRKIATLYRRSRYLMNQDEFLKRMDELESELETGRERREARG